MGLLQPTVFSKLPNLEAVNLSKNNRLLLAKPRVQEFVTSESLQFINLSYCNMEHVELQGFPGLKYASLGFNMIKTLNQNSFAHNTELETLDLTMNSLTFVNVSTFRDLKKLQELDLSYNVLSAIDRELFKQNTALTVINLSQNYIAKLPRLVAQSVVKLNFSRCEIMYLDPNTLSAMPMLVELDLSYNILPEFPPKLESETLQDLNLANNRIVNVRNTSFLNLPDLTRLNLVGNRLTTPLKREVFKFNRFLQEIKLGDNPWICECRNVHFHDFYIYLVEPPRKVRRDSSPEILFLN